MTLQATNLFYYVVGGIITEHPKYKSPYERPPEFGAKDPDTHLAARGHYRLHYDNGGNQPNKWHSRITGEPVVDQAQQRVTRIDSWQKWSADQIRQNHEREIEIQRHSSEIPNIDLRRDPGLIAVMDELNAAADRAIDSLDLTPDIDLETFDPTLDPQSADSVELSASLAAQGRHLLDSPTPMTPDQRLTLQTVITEWQSVIDQQDMYAIVAEVPSFARRAIGVIAEDYGYARARRFFESGWWWFEIEMQIERELEAGSTYFIAIYDISAPDDRDDTTSAYRTTAQLTDMGNGRFLADKNAINLPKPNTSEGYKFTLCKNHISAPQFDRVSFPPDELARRYRFRWGGLT